MIMNTRNIAELSRRSHTPYRTTYSYVRGEKLPKPETARILARITGGGTDEETLIWLSKDMLVDIHRSLDINNVRRDGGIVLYDVTNSSYEGKTCPLAKYGHSKNGNKRLPVIAME